MSMNHSALAVSQELANDLLAGRVSFLTLLNDPGQASGDHGLNWLWSIVHFALTGDVDPAESVVDGLVYGSAELPDDTGYGPPGLLKPADVAELSAALAAIDGAALAGSMDLGKAREQGVYAVDACDESELRTLVAEQIEASKRFVADTAAAGQCVVTAIY